MKDHVDDFCYWIDESNLNKTDLPQKISAMFIEEIGINTFDRLAWTEWEASEIQTNEMQRVFRLKGIFQYIDIIRKQNIYEYCGKTLNPNIKIRLVSISEKVILNLKSPI